MTLSPGILTYTDSTGVLLEDGSVDCCHQVPIAWHAEKKNRFTATQVFPKVSSQHDVARQFRVTRN